MGLISARRAFVRTWLLLGGLVACGNETPTQCKQPVRIYFERCLGLCMPGVQLPVAVGGTLTFTPYCLPPDDQCTGMACFLPHVDVPYAAEDDGGAVHVVDVSASEALTVTGVADGTSTISLRDLDGRSFGSDQLSAKAIDHIDLQPLLVDMIPANAQLAFSTQATDWLEVYLRAANNWALADDSMVLVLPSGATPLNQTRFDIHGLAEGSFTVEVTAGGATTNVPLEIANTSDAVAPQDPPTKIDGGPATTPVCFAATKQSRFISGLTWTYLVDGVSPLADRVRGNCVYVHPTDDLDPLGSITVTATAGGQSATITLPL